jgi:copper chaperone
MPTQTYVVEGMSCTHCIRAVRNALDAVEGITVEEVGLGIVRVESVPDSPPTGDITAAIENAGYRVVGVTG